MTWWRFKFRDDQCRFIMGAMDYIIERCDERISDLKSEAFNSFAAKATRDRAIEIRDEIKMVIT